MRKEPVPPEEAVAEIFQGLEADSATGPDMLPTKVLNECAEALAKPIHIRILALLIFQQGMWPEASTTRWIVSFFQKGPVSQPVKYRGILLTPQLSKVMERLHDGSDLRVFACQC